MLYETMIRGGDENLSLFLRIYPLFLLYAVLFSLPGLIIYMILFRWLERKPYSVPYKKRLLVMTAFICILATWQAVSLMINHRFVPRVFDPYAVTAILAGFAFRLQKRKGRHSGEGPTA
jgi:hypothetical protein